MSNRQEALQDAMELTKEDLIDGIVLSVWIENVGKPNQVNHDGIDNYINYLEGQTKDSLANEYIRQINAHVLPLYENN